MCNEIFLLGLVKKKFLPVDIYGAVRPVGSIWPRLYGLPKTHKNNVPFLPVLSMVRSI